MKGWSDAFLARRIRSGRAGAFEQLVRTHHVTIYRFLAHLCRSADVAEDLCQETFTAAWSGIGEFNGRCSLRTWLCRIAFHKFVDWYRQSRRELASRREAPEGVPDSTSPDPLDALLLDERSRSLHQAVARLDEDDRRMIVMHYLQRLTYRQMSSVLGQPSGTVKWRVNMAMIRLRQILDSGVRHEEHA